MKKITAWAILFFWMAGIVSVNAQLNRKISIHSHNDYDQANPFWGAYNARSGSIEADIFQIDGDLFVSHNRKDVKPERTLRAMYLDPIRKMFEENGHSGYPNGETYQLMIDLKTDAASTLPVLLKILEEYKACFDHANNPHAVKIVITGHKLTPDRFGDFGENIFFDGLIGETYTPAQRKHIALVSQTLRKYSSWNGKESMTKADQKKIKKLIKHAHRQGLKIRFWQSPDTELAWRTAKKMKIDFINSDHPAEVAAFLKQ